MLILIWRNWSACHQVDKNCPISEDPMVTVMLKNGKEHDTFYSLLRHVYRVGLGVVGVIE